MVRSVNPFDVQVNDVTLVELERWLSSEYLEKFFGNLNRYYSALRSIKTDLNGPTLLPPLDMPSKHLPDEQDQVKALDDYCSYLKIIEQVVSKNRMHSLAIVESSRFNCIATFVGLIMCPIPKKLKVSLIDCCAASAKAAPETALALWNKLGVLVPALANNKTGMPSGSSEWQSGIMMEIEDLEPRAQQYSLTISFIKLLENVLGSIAHHQYIQQQASLETCLNLIINLVMLKLNSRQFNKKEEKWIILNSCISTLNYFVSIYDPATDGTSSRCSFRLMSQILQDGAIFKCLMLNIEDVVDEMEFALVNSTQPNESGIQNISLSENGNKDQNECNSLMDNYVVLSLKLLNCLFAKQSGFMEIIRHILGYPTASNVKLNVLLDGVNYRTGAVDRLATLVRVVALCSPESCNQALLLLRSVMEEQPNLAQQISLHLSSSKSQLVHGDNLVTIFVNCLSSETKEVRIGALRLISSCLNYKSGSGRAFYNLGHELLGFDHHMTTLRLPDSEGKTFDCLHSIIGLFSPESFTHPEIREERTYGLEILHKICVDGKTCDISLRFLRTSYEFITKYLNCLYRLFDNSSPSKLIEERLDELVWLLRLIAVEVKLTSERNMRSIITNYMNLLVADKPRRILELLPNSVCAHSHPPMPNWECFDNDEVWQLIVDQADNNAVIDLKNLRHKLLSEVKIIHSRLGSAQNDMVRNEIEEISAFATQLNASYKQQTIKCSYFNAWRELAETIMTVNALKGFEDDLTVRILFEIIHELMSRTNLPGFSYSNLFTPITSTVLIASSTLHDIGPKTSTTTDFVAIVNTIRVLLEQSSGLLWGQLKRARVNLYSAYLHASRALPGKLLADLKFSPSLIEKICKDALRGETVTKVVAISILTESDLSWVNDATRDGSLRLLLESLLADDAEIVATKCEVVTKAFYAFESKVTLFTKIASTLNGAKQLVHLNLMDIITSLKSTESYLFVLNEKNICQKLFISVMRLMRTLSITLRANNRNLLMMKYPKIYSEILRNIPVLKKHHEGLDSLLVMTSLLSQIIVHADTRLRHDFVTTLQHFTDGIGEIEMKILANVLIGCMKILKAESYMVAPLFAPVWNPSNPSVMMSQQGLGVIIAVINNVSEQHPSSQGDHTVRETVMDICIYLIWFHMKLYTDTGYHSEVSRDLEAFKSETQVVLSDGFFNRISSCKSDFVEVFSRRLKKLVRAKTQ